MENSFFYFLVVGETKIMLVNFRKFLIGLRDGFHLQKFLEMLTFSTFSPLLFLVGEAQIRQSDIFIAKRCLEKMQSKTC